MSQPRIQPVPAFPSCVRALVVTLLLLQATWQGRAEVQRVSVAKKALPGSTATGNSANPQFSKDGRLILFNSTAGDLLQNPATGFALDVYVRDLSTGLLRLVSASADAVSGGDRNSMALGCSRDGSRILFLSEATNLLPNDTNAAPDLFVRDMVSQKTFLVSVGTEGEFVSDGGWPEGVITEDGQRVFFESLSSSLVTGDFNGESDVFVRDLSTGLTTRINGAADGGEALGGASHLEAISANGNRAVFTSLATNLTASVVDGKTATTVYVRDLKAGSLRRLFVEYPPETFGLTNAQQQALRAVNVVMSGDGRYVAFATVRRIENDPTRAQGHVFWFDLESGTSVMASGERNAGIYGSLLDDSGPVMSGDGRTIAFEASFDSPLASVTSLMIWRADGSVQTLENPFIDALIPPPHAIEPVLSADGKQVLFVTDEWDAAPEMQLYLHRLDYSGPLDFGFRPVAVTPGGAGAGGGQFSTYEFSPDGLQVVYDSTSSRIVAGDDNHSSDIFLRELGTLRTELLSPGTTDENSLDANGISTQPVISGNGRYVFFTSLASNLAGIDDNEHADIFRRDLETGITELVSVRPDGFHSANAGASSPSVSADGRYVVFVSQSTNLVEQDNTSMADVMLRDMQTGRTRLVSRSLDRTGPGDAPSSQPVISADGSVVVFFSAAMNLIPNTPFIGAGRNHVFAYDVGADTLRLLSQTELDESPMAGALSRPSLSGDGRTVAFLALASGSSRRVAWLLDPLHPVPLPLHTNSFFQATFGIWVSDDGSSVVFESSDSNSPRQFIQRHDLVTGQRTRIPMPETLTSSQMATIGGISRDGRLAVFTSTASLDAADTNGLNDVFLAQFDSLTLLRVSRASKDGSGGNGSSDSPTIAPDGSRVVFHSKASDLVEGDLNGFSDIFEYDLVQGTTRLVSINSVGLGANGHSSQPRFSADARRIAFVSWADDLVGDDFNGLGDVFVAGNFNGAQEDSDRDGLLDAWELAEFGNLLADGLGDDDGDGTTNAYEFLVGTHPKRADSVFRPQMRHSELGSTLVWDGILGKRYTVEVANDFRGPWVALGVFQGTGRQESFSIKSEAGGPSEAWFYRIHVQ